MHRRLAALFGMIGFVLVAGYWALRALTAMIAGAGESEMLSASDILVRALAAMVACFALGWLLARLGIGLIDEAREQAEATQVGVMPPELEKPGPVKPLKR